MAGEELKALSRRSLDELFNAGNLDAADELYASDFVAHDPALPDPVRGPAGIKELVTGYRAAFPDLRVSVDQQVSEGDTVATRWTAKGTHQGELFGIAPTGKQATITGISIERISNDKIAEEWISWDTLGLLQQLGAVPALATA